MVVYDCFETADVRSVSMGIRACGVQGTLCHPFCCVVVAVAVVAAASVAAPDRGRSLSHVLLQLPPSLLPASGQHLDDSDVRTPRSNRAKSCAAGPSSCSTSPDTSSNYVKQQLAEEVPQGSLQGDPSDAFGSRGASVSLHPSQHPPKLSFLQGTETSRFSASSSQNPMKQLERAVKEAFYSYPLYESHFLKLYLHREGQKKLLADIHRAGGFDVDVHPEASEEWQWMGSLARSYLQKDAGAEETKSSASFLSISTPEVPQTLSVLQSHLDEQCQLLFPLGTPSAARLQGSDVFCFPLSSLDLNQKGFCVDVCFNQFECPGKPTDASQAIQLDIDRPRELKRWCTPSELHRKVEQIVCGESLVLRLTSEDDVDWVCLPMSGKYIEMSVFSCLGPCGEQVACLSPLAIVIRSGNLPVLAQHIEQQKSPGCGCEEGTVGANYAGCQSKTRLGKKCQNWNSQTPHKHETLTDENHNYCRSAGQGDSIWCFTTDPDVRSDFCDPLGPKTQLVQPGDTIDLVLEGFFSEAYYDLAFFMPSILGDGARPCGPGLETRDIHLKKSSNGTINKALPRLSAGGLSALIWQDVQVESSAHGSYSICLCDYSYYLADDPVCTRAEHYSLHAGWLHVKGPKKELETFDVQTGTPASVSLTGFGYTIGDTVSITRSSYNCDFSAVAFAESMGSLLLRGAEAYRQLAFALELGTATAAKLTPTSIYISKNVTSLPLPAFTIYQTGVYYACWSPSGSNVSLPAAKINVTGVELRRHFYALYVSNSSKVEDRPFSIFIKARGPVPKPLDSEIYLTKPANTPCGGTIVGRPKEVVEQPVAEDSETKFFIAEQMTVGRLGDGENTSEGTLEVCLELEQKAYSLGVAHLSRALVYPLDLFQRGSHGSPGIPHSTFSLTVEKFSALGLHWIGAETETDCFFEQDLHAFFSQGDFPKALSFWVEETGVSVWYSSIANPTPKALAWFSAPDVSAVAVHADSSRVLFFLLKKEFKVLEVYDMTKPRHLSELSPLATTSGTTLLFEPTGLALLQEKSECRVVVADRRRKQILLFDSGLQLLEAQSTWPNMSGPLEGPRSVFCIPTPDRSSSNLFDCYLADQETGRLILLQYDTTTNTSSFVSEVSSNENGSHKLVEPKLVVVYAYNGYTLLYVAEEGKTEPMLLTKPYGHSEMRLYQRLDSVSAGETDMKWMCLLQTGDASGGLSGVWLMTFHNSYDGPMVHLVPLDTTATTPDFKYTPREWYALGEEHRLEPSIVGASSNAGLASFALNPAAASFAFMERNVSIEETSGTITLRLIDIQEEPITVEVIGSGVVNSVNTSFTFRVGCKDGHYYSNGMCIKCQTGSFNSLALVKESPTSYFHACRKCADKRSTVAEGSTSNEQCLCEKGYHLDKETEECVPCAEGSYKDTVADTGCTGGGCPPHSVSHVVGAVSSEERYCSCLPGYYAVYTDDEMQCLEVEEGYFSLGGYGAQRISCPPFTSTNAENGLSVDLTHCLCKPGYAPASAESLADPTTPASLLKRWLLLNPFYASLQDTQVCMLCGRRHYKGRVSAEACIECPLNSFSSEDGPTDKSSCNMCLAGYYHTSNEDLPCGECQAHHFCVGSEPAVESLAPLAGDKIPCSDYTETIEPNSKNTDPFSCMCMAGYEYAGIDNSTHKVTCRPVPLGSYKESIGNLEAIKCPPGSNTLSTASKSLSDCVCSAGYYLDQDSRVCQPCPVGAYCLGGIDATTNLHSSFVLCPPNTTTKGEMSSSLKDCMCDKGYYRAGSGTTMETVTCNKCRVNSYKDWIGNDNCKQCSENSGMNVTGSTSSAQCLCSPGYYYNSELRECLACKQAYKYCPGGETDCSEDDKECVNGKKPIQPVDCPKHTRITEGFDTPATLDDCKCDRGYAFKYIDVERNVKVCEPCSEGSYKTTVQDINCNGLCGVSSTSLEGAQAQAQCFCEEGTYYAAGVCHACPDGAVCLGGLVDAAVERLLRDPSYVEITVEDHVKPYPQAGYYLNKQREVLTAPSDWQFLKCPIADACLEFGVCASTMGNYLCSECKFGYTNGFQKDEFCTACPSQIPNALLFVGYQLALLLFNVGMAYMNVAAGFNRRSIHSIVIKIASNFLTCMSVLTVVDFNQISLPTWVTSLTRNVSETIIQKEASSTRFTAVECLLREGFSLSFSDSFFYSMLLNALLPIMLPVIATFILYFFLHRFQHYYRNSIKKKLLLLGETERYGLTSLTVQLRERYEEDRAFMMFRYVPIPGDSQWRRWQKFVEDMIPIYVTVLFFLYTATTRHMLSLLDCSVIDYGSAYGSKSFLRAAMSIECRVEPSSDYFKFFALGIVGIAVWSVGIPLVSFSVLYANRKKLNSRETRLKFGFLHNGFVKQFWFWETVVFARKFSVLVVSSVLVSSSSNNGSRLWPACVVAVVFNIYHLNCQPFDKRNYSTLDNLENHSMSIWTLTICIMLAIAGSNFDANVNVALAIVVVVALLLFGLEVLVNLMFAYFDNVRANRSFFKVPVIGYLFRAFARWSEKRKSWEPLVVYDVENDIIRLIAAKRHRTLKISTKQSTTRINSKERQYFLKVMAETLGFAVVHMKLDVIPGTFLEFVLRLGFAFHKVEEETQESNKSLQAIARGDISMLADWSLQQKQKLSRRGDAIKDEPAKAEPLEGFFKRIEKKLIIDQKKIKRRRLKDIEGGYSASDLEMEEKEEEEDDDEEEEEKEKGEEGEDAGEQDDENQTNDQEDISDEDQNTQLLNKRRNAASPNVERLMSELGREEQRESAYIFDNEVMECGLPLSELYLALLKLQLEDAATISHQYESFRARKAAYLAKVAEKLKRRNRKLRLIRYALQAAAKGAADSDIEALGFTAEAFSQIQEKVETLIKQQRHLKETLNRLKSDPDSYQGEDLHLEWVDVEGAGDDDALGEKQDDSEKGSEKTPASEDSENHSELPSRSSSNHSESSEDEKDVTSNKPIYIIGADAEAWAE